MPEVWWVRMIPLVFVGIRLILVGVDARLALAGQLRAAGRGGRHRRRHGYSLQHRPLVRVVLPDSRTVEAEAMVVEHPGSKWRWKGVETTVIYDPANPTSVAIEGTTTGGRLL